MQEDPSMMLRWQSGAAFHIGGLSLVPLSLEVRSWQIFQEVAQLPR
jgi:hypothetical protein